jgi:hypothetical protein
MEGRGGGEAQGVTDQKSYFFVHSSELAKTRVCIQKPVVHNLLQKAVCPNLFPALPNVLVDLKFTIYVEHWWHYSY